MKVITDALIATGDDDGCVKVCSNMLYSVLSLMCLVSLDRGTATETYSALYFLHSDMGHAHSQACHGSV